MDVDFWECCQVDEVSMLLDPVRSGVNMLSNLHSVMLSELVLCCWV